MGKRSRVPVALLILVITYCVYALAFIYRTSYVIGGQRYFSLFDDGMISMRYAYNLAHGHGLVWNLGERIEGYTNPLWVLYMALLHLIPVGLPRMSLLVQLSGMIFLALNMVFVYKLAGAVSCGSRPVSIAAAFITAFYLPLNNWGLQGMEVSALALIVTTSAWMAIRCRDAGRACVWPFVLLGIGTLVRMDMVVPLLALLVFLLVTDSANRRVNALAGIAALVLFLSAQTAFRVAYYHDLLPNTYYLKMTGYPMLLRVTRGLYVLFGFIQQMNWLLFALPFGMLMLKRDRGVALLLWLFSSQMAYSVYVGGDAWEWWGGANRYISIAMPLFFVSFCWALARVHSILSRSARDSETPVGAWERYGFGGLVFLSLLSFNFIHGPGAWADTLLIRRPLHFADNQRMTETAVLLDEITTDNARVAVVAAGTIPYFSGRYSVDILGKNDRRIARMPARVPSGLGCFTGFLPGHLKWDYSYSIGDQKPDVVAQLWQSKEEATPYLIRDYRRVDIRGITLYLRRDSHEILWDRVGDSWMP